MMSRSFTLAMLCVLCAAVAVSALPPLNHQDKSAYPDLAAAIDNTHYINANNILMFVTNHGSFARDLADVFGNSYGCYYPYTAIADIQNGTNTTSPLYAAGLWLGGKVNSQTRVTISEYSSEYVPGPMAFGTYQGDRPNYRVYKLHADSLASNPNYDYLNWPVGQGAPTNPDGTPAMLGEQMIWTVFNDANPSVHDNDAGSTTPLGIEVQLTAWTGNATVSEEELTELEVHPGGPFAYAVRSFVILSAELTGHDYQVSFDGERFHWDDLTASTRLWTDSLVFLDSVETPVVDGLKIIVTREPSGVFFENFEVVSNAAGPLVPSEGAALSSAGFPSGPISDRQQVGPARWAIHTGDFLSDPRPLYQDFLRRTFRQDPDRIQRFAGYDYEIRFTGSYSNPGIAGSYAWNWAIDESAVWIPLELWRIGSGTPDDTSDDLRMIPYIFDGGNDGLYSLVAYGSEPNCGPDGCDHSASAADDDPHTDWIYFSLPNDTTPGDAAYLAFEQEMLSTPEGRLAAEELTIDRIVFISLDAGSAPPFNQELPEQGTVFRLTSGKSNGTPGIFTFTAPEAESPSNPDDSPALIHLNYLMLNKGNNIIQDAFISLWADPDLGGAGDDLVGCDTLKQIWFCYNGDNDDTQYGNEPPAIGFQVQAGPIVPSPGDTAILNGIPRPNYTNLGISSFNAYENGTDPNDYTETYNYMQGLRADGSVYQYNGTPTKFVYSGDPVTRIGDLDSNPADRRMMASFGPFTFLPGDTQQLAIQMGVAQGGERLSSITLLRFLFDSQIPPPPPCCTGIRGNVTGDPNNQIDIADLIYLVQYLFVGGPPPLCIEEGDVTGNGLTDIADLAVLVGYMFKDGPAPMTCP